MGIADSPFSPNNWLKDLSEGADAAGNFLDNVNPLGINLGIGGAARFVGNFVPGMVHLVRNSGNYLYDTAAGNDTTKDYQTLEQTRNALAHGVEDTGTDLVTGGGLAPWSSWAEGRIRQTNNALGLGDYKPRSIYDYATNPGQGIAGALINDAMNISVAAKGTKFVSESGSIGELAKAGNAAAEDAVGDTTGAVTPESARLDTISKRARDMAGSEGLAGDDLTARADQLTAQAVQRAQRLQVISKFEKPLTSVFQDVLRQPGRAIKAADLANATPETGTAQPPGEETTPAPPPAGQAVGPTDHLPPVAEGYTRLFHGDRVPGEEGHGAVIDAQTAYPDHSQFSTDYHDAASYGSKVSYLDAPTENLGGEHLPKLEQSYDLSANGTEPVATHYGVPRDSAERMQQPVGEGGGGVKTAEAPPAPTVAEHAAAYKAAQGIEETGRPVPADLKVNPKFHADVAKAYDEMKNEPHNPRVRAAYRALLDETKSQFHYMTEDPNGPHLHVEWHDGGQQESPYYAGGATDEVAHQRMLEDVRNNNHLWVNKTLPGESHPVFTPEENDVFRAVHDYFGHAAAGNNFGRAGEEIAYRLHSQMFSPAAQEALATETRGQNSWLNFSEHNDLRRAGGQSAEFPEQKAGILPAEARGEYPLLPQSKLSKSAAAELVAKTNTERPIPKWATTIEPFIPAGLRALAKSVDWLGINRESAAVLRQNTRLIRAAAASARLSPVVMQSVDLAKNTLVEGGMEPSAANVAVASRALLTAATGPLYDLIQGHIDNGDITPALGNAALAGILGAPWTEVPKELDTPAFRARIAGIAELYKQAAEERGQALTEDPRMGDRGLEGVTGDQPTPTKMDQGRMALIQNLAAKAQELEQVQAPLERIQLQADILDGRDRLGALGAKRQSALADQEQSVADFDRSRAPLAMRNDAVWGKAVDAIVQQTLDPEGFGGATFSQHTNDFVTAETGATYSVGVLPDTALEVPLTGTAVVDAEHLASAIDEVAHRYQDLLRDPDTVLGTWTKDGVVHVDISQTTLNGRPLQMDQADIYAAARGQQATWDFQGSAERVPLLPQDVALDLASTDMRQTGRVMGQLRQTIDQINGATDPRAVARRPDVLISPAEADAHAAMMQRDAVMAFRNNPGRWSDADKVFGGLDIKYLGPRAAGKLSGEALLQRVMLGRDYTPELWNEARANVEHFAEATQWYHSTNAFLRSQFTNPDGTEKTLLMPDPRVGGTREVSPVEVASQLLGATSKNTPVRENLGQTMGILGRYAQMVGELGEHNVHGLQELWERDYFAERRAGVRPYETTMAKRLFPGTGIGFSTSKTAVLEILSGQTHDLWMEPVHEMIPEWAPQVNDVLDRTLRTPTGRLIEKAQPGLLDRLRPAGTDGLPSDHPEVLSKVEDMVAELRKAKAVKGDKEFSKLVGYLRQYSDQTMRLEDGRLPYLEARRPAMMDKASPFGAMPQSLDPVPAIEAINRMDPTIIPRIGEDRAVMEYYGGAAAAKPRSFAENIAHPENPDAATIDQHQARLRDVDEKTLSNPGVYLREAEALRALRDTMNDPQRVAELQQAVGRAGGTVTAQELQAGLWVHARMLQGHEETTGGDFRSVYEGEHPTAHTFNANRETYAANHDVLWQRFQARVLGAFQPSTDGERALMGFTRDANIGTLFHESAHWMRTLVGPEDMGLLERAYGVMNGVWKAGHEERFAEDFMRYLEGGHGPAEVQTVFEKIRNWLGGSWRMITRNGGAEDIHPAVRQVLDGWFHPERETGPIDSSPTLPTPKEDVGTLAQRARRTPPSARFETPAQAATRGAEQQAALDDFSAAVKRQRDAEIAAKKAQASVAKMEKAATEPTQAEVMAAAMRGRALKLAGKVQESIDNPSASRTPPRWQPVLRAANEIAAMVKDHPELEPVLSDLPQTFGAAQALLNEAGFDPTHMSDWSTSKVRALAYGTARLGPPDRGAGTEVIASSRKARGGYLATRELANRSIESIAAMMAEPMQEARSNHVVDFMERNWARRIPNGAEVPKGYTLWSPVKRGLLGIQTPEGATTAVGEQLVIPTEVARVLKRYSADGIDNPLIRGLQRVQSPWKSALLTWSPKFYLNHILGHVVLGALGGAVKLSDWTKAYAEMRSGFANLPEVTAQSLVQAELGSTAFVDHPTVGNARAVGGNLEAVRQVSRNLHRVVNTADSFARAAVVMGDVRRGMSVEDALQHAAEALVDYNDLNAVERSAVRAIVPFYGFQKGVLRLVARLPLDHPIGAGMIMKVGQLNDKWAVDANGDPLPDAYSGILDVPGLGATDTKPINPLKDAESLITPAGIMSSLHPIVKLMVDAAVGAPQLHVDSSGRIVANRGQTFHVGPTGAPVADINPTTELQSLFETTPQVSAIGAAVGSGSSPGLGGIASALLPLRNEATITRAADRAKSTELALPKYGPEQAAKAYAKFLAGQGGQSASAPSLLPTAAVPTGGAQAATQAFSLPATPLGGTSSGGLTQKGRIMQAAYSNRGGHYGIRKSRRRGGGVKRKKSTAKLGFRKSGRGIV